MNRWQKLLFAFVAPRKLFLELDKNPTWGMPFAIVIGTSALTSIIVTWLKSDVIIEQLRTKLMRQGLSESQVEAAEMFATGPVALFLTGISTLLVMSLGFLIASAIVSWLIKLLDGQTSFKKTFSVFSSSSIVLILGNLTMIIGVLTSNILLSPSFFAAVLPIIDKSSPFGLFLARIDLFSVWHLGLFSFGLSLITKLSKTECVFVVFGIWLIYLWGRVLLVRIILH